jgi:2-polyprenyl-3-methyl-5-hydroxy-6-metoxy-1,4-benzoquinol methylase
MIRKITHRLRAKILIPKLMKVIKPEESIIDIGANNGIVTNELLHAGFNIQGAADIENSLHYDFDFYPIWQGKINASEKQFDIALLIDVLHHIPKEKQKEIIAEAQRVAKKVVICETLPNWCAYFVDWLNSLKGMPAPYAFRKADEWNGNNVLFISSPWWYPLKHVVIL